MDFGSIDRNAEVESGGAVAVVGDEPDADGEQEKGEKEQARGFHGDLSWEQLADDCILARSADCEGYASIS